MSAESRTPIACTAETTLLGAWFGLLAADALTASRLEPPADRWLVTARLLAAGAALALSARRGPLRGALVRPAFGFAVCSARSLALFGAPAPVVWSLALLEAAALSAALAEWFVPQRSRRR